MKTVLLVIPLKNLWHKDVTHEESKSLKKWESKQIWLEKYAAEFKHESFLKPPRKYNESKPTGDLRQQGRRGMTDKTHLQSINKQPNYRQINSKQFQNNRSDERKSPKFAHNRPKYNVAAINNERIGQNRFQHNITRNHPSSSSLYHQMTYAEVARILSKI